MAEKVLQTRIINKHADLNTWNSSSLILKEGEIALAYVNTTKPDGNGGTYTVPTYLMKVGDGEKTFSQLEWLAAPASDVYAWAKAATKPSYAATEITRGTSNVATDLKAAEDAITALQAAMGDADSVATLIENALKELDNNDAEVDKQFVTAAVQTDGTVAVTRRALVADDIPTLAISKIDGLSEAIADAKKAGTDAAEALSTYKTTNDTRVAGIEGVLDTYGDIVTHNASEFATSAQGEAADDALAKANTNATAISNLAGTGRTTETVKGNADAIAQLKTDIGNVANVMNFRGVSTGATAGADISDPKAGDVIIYGEAEYVYDESGAWIKFGDASDNATAISDLQTRMTTVEGVLNGVNDSDGLVDNVAANTQAIADETSARESADNEINAKIGGNYSATSTVAAAISAATEAASDARSAIDTHAGRTDNPHEVTAAQVGLGNVENKSTATIKSEFTGAVAGGNTGFVTGDAAHAAIEAAKTAAASDAAAKVKVVADALDTAEADISTIQNTYVRVDGDALVYGQGDSVMTIVFDCGGAE